MNYPELGSTPIKETIFSLSYNEIVNSECFEKFIKLEYVKSKFEDINPTVDQKLKFDNSGNIEISPGPNGVALKNENEIIQIRTGSFSLHHLNGYKNFKELLESFLKFWNEFDKVTKDDLTITDYSVRYVNLIEADEENEQSRIIQIYPKYSSDREIKNFQNSVQYSYKDSPDYMLNVVSTKLNNKSIILDITAKGSIEDILKNQNDLSSLFMPLRDLKNRAFIDSISARTLLKYMK